MSSCTKTSEFRAVLLTALLSVAWFPRATRDVSTRSALARAFLVSAFLTGTDSVDFDTFEINNAASNEETSCSLMMSL